MTSQNPLSGSSLGVMRWPTYGLGQLYRSAHARIEARLGEVDQSLRTYYVLVSLSEENGISQQEVCDRIGMDRGDMVRLIDDLEAKGHVKRTRDPKDRRRHQLSLTSYGQKARKRCDEILATTTDEVFSELSSKERRTLHRLVLRALGQPTAIADELKPPGRPQTRAPSPSASAQRPDAAPVEEPLALPAHAAQGHESR